MINNLYTLIENRKYLSQRKQLLKLEKKLHFLADLNDGCGVTKYEFILTILEHIGKLDRKTDIEPWLKVSFLNAIAGFLENCIYATS